MTTINAITSPAPALVTTVDSTGNLVMQTAGTNAVTYDANQNAKHTGSISSVNTFGFKNRIINGAMVIDQRNAGASVTNPASNIYTVDRWCLNTGFTGSVGQNLGSVTPPVGYVNYLGASSSTTNSATNYFFRQQIEGYNIADLNWGGSNAKTITLSFWVRCSLTGTFGGAFQNDAQDRSYVFSYTIPTANTWQQVSITIAGDTTGTWLTNNGAGIRLWISYGAIAGAQGSAGWQAGDVRSITGQVNVMGTSGATFYITGVQLEVGSSATGFEYRQYTNELALCQRYYQFGGNSFFSNYGGSSGGVIMLFYKVSMRATPTITSTLSPSSGSGVSTEVGNIYILTNSTSPTTWTATAEL